MIHGINNNFLYAVSHIETHFVKEGAEMQIRCGTGFFIRKGDKGYFITNRHLIDITRETGCEQFQDYELNSVVFDIRKYDEQNQKVVTEIMKVKEFNQLLPNDFVDDVACLYNFVLQGHGVTVENAFDFEMLADKECLNNQISVGDNVATIGFPATVYDHLNNMPILRAGVISSDPRLNYSSNSNYMGRIIAYEAFSTGGASGSPVIALQKGFRLGTGLSGPADFFRPVKVIGINAGNFNSGGVHQQLSFLYKSDIIIDLILAAENDNSATT